MNSDLFGKTFRHLLTFAGGIVVGKGWISAEIWEMAAGGIMSLASAGFMYWANSKKSA